MFHLNSILEVVFPTFIHDDFLGALSVFYLPLLSCGLYEEVLHLLFEIDGVTELLFDRPPPLGLPVVEGHPPPLPCPVMLVAFAIMKLKFFF